jgi:hypothetical protein
VTLASPPAPGDTRCHWCGTSTGTRYCSKRCRQTAWRARQVSLLQGDDGGPRRIAYADPPYPGTARKYYRAEPTYRGEVDHGALISTLQTFDGWALSTSQKALRDVLTLSPAGVRVAAWVKPIGACPNTRGPHNTWEPVVYLPARRRRPGVRDWLSALPARGGGTLPGRKPMAFCLWLFRLLGMVPGDRFDDLFPGTGIVGRCWRASSSSPGDANRDLESATSRAALSDGRHLGSATSARPSATSPEYSSDAVAAVPERPVAAGAERRRPGGAT